MKIFKYLFKNLDLEIILIVIFENNFINNLNFHYIKLTNSYIFIFFN